MTTKTMDPMRREGRRQLMKSLDIADEEWLADLRRGDLDRSMRLMRTLHTREPRASPIGSYAYAATVLPPLFDYSLAYPGHSPQALNMSTTSPTRTADTLHSAACDARTMKDLAKVARRIKRATPRLMPHHIADLAECMKIRGEIIPNLAAIEARVAAEDAAAELPDHTSAAHAQYNRELRIMFARNSA